MSNLEVLTARGDDLQRWKEVYASLFYDLRDVHLTPEYGLAQERDGDVAHLAVYRDDLHGGYTVQPFLLRAIPGSDYRDMTAIGYGGPFTTVPLASPTAGFDFAEALLDWQTAYRVVADFYLVNPVFAPLQWVLLPPNYTHFEKHAIILPTSGSLDNIRPTRRQALAKATAAAEVVCFWGEEALTYGESFYRLYLGLMDRKSAPVRWRLSHEYVRGLFTHLKDNALMTWATQRLPAIDTEADAAAVFLFGSAVAYYSLAATGDLRPQGLADLNIATALTRAEERGIPWLHLGGGVTSDLNDSLFLYKRSFGGLIRPVFSVRNVIDQAAYSALCAAVRQPVANPFFPAYRALEAMEAHAA